MGLGNALAHLTLAAWAVHVASVIASPEDAGKSYVAMYRVSSLPTDPNDQLIDRAGGNNYSVWDKGLVKESTSWREVVRHHGNSARKADTRFEGPVLAYVTPWNSRGYDAAKTFAERFSHVSPVWYQLKWSEGCFLSGQHDVDQDWIEAVRTGIPQDSTRQSPKIVPRVVVEMLPMDAIGVLLDQPQDALAILTVEAKQQKFDGWVLEVWSQWAAYRMQDDPQLQQRVYNFIQHIGQGLHKQGLELHLAVPPMQPCHPMAPAFTAEDLHGVWEAVDGLSVMTYDHAQLEVGPSAPLDWVLANAEALSQAAREAAKKSGRSRNRDGSPASSKIMLGLNFYGMDFTLSGTASKQPIVGHELVAKLKRYRPKFRWEEQAAEHSFGYITNGRTHRVYYPSLLSVEKRLQIAREEGVGVAIWEIGQGLDYFFDLF